MLYINTADPGNAIVWNVLRVHVAAALRAARPEGWQNLNFRLGDYIREFRFCIKHCSRSAESRSEIWEAYAKPRMHNEVETPIGRVEIDDLVSADEEFVQARLTDGELMICELMAQAVEGNCTVRMAARSTGRSFWIQRI
ncbi:hypothetical protein B0H16DRAFT_1731780 [Mycena metata]|uniref:Uncharacterized protein n=1 Tax=Mycena metata TaxID=1033252 RepID=A0AAD7MVT1_9AGAR|nr:hypothetical protein B0H16DRAFT_1731780 [Mycena metata]